MTFIVDRPAYGPRTINEQSFESHGVYMYTTGVYTKLGGIHDKSRSCFSIIRGRRIPTAPGADVSCGTEDTSPRNNRLLVLKT